METPRNRAIMGQDLFNPYLTAPRLCGKNKAIESGNAINGKHYVFIE